MSTFDFSDDQNKPKVTSPKSTRPAPSSVVSGPPGPAGPPGPPGPGGPPGPAGEQVQSVFTATAKGLTPPSGGGNTKFLRADGTFAEPPTGSGGGGSGPISSADITDATAAGRAMLTAATATSQTALLSNFSPTAKGLVPPSGGGTANFLRADGTFSAPPGSGGGTTGPAAVGAKWVSTKDGISTISFPTVASGGPVLILVHGLATEGDISTPFYMKRVASTAVAWDNYMTATDAAGQKWEIMAHDDEIMFEWLGTPLDDFVPAGTPSLSATPYFNAFKAWCRGRYGDAHTFPILRETAYRYWDGTIVLSYGRFRLYGQGGSSWRFKSKVNYIIIDAYDTSNGTVSSFDPNRDAGGSEVIGFTCWGSFNPDVTFTNIGFWVRCRAIIKDCNVSHAGKWGVFEHGDTAGGSGGNNNNWRIESISCAYNGLYGLGVFGSDANAGAASGLSSMYGNGSGGLEENSFLANYYGFFHYEGNNGSGSPGVVWPTPGVAWYQGSIYRATVGNETSCSTTVPGTDDAKWEYMYDDPTHSSRGVPTWRTGLTWQACGDVVQRSGSPNAFMGSYHEGDGWPLQIAGQSYYFGGGFGGDVSRHSNGNIDRQGIRKVGGYTNVQREAFDITSPNRQFFTKVGTGGYVLSFGHYTGEGSTPDHFFGLRSLTSFGQRGSFELTAVDSFSTSPAGGGYGTFILSPQERFDASTYGGSAPADFWGTIHLHKWAIGSPGRQRRVWMQGNAPTSSVGPFGPWGAGDIIHCSNPSSGVKEWVIERGATDPAGYAYRTYPTSGGTLVTGTNDVIPNNLSLTALTNQALSTLVTSNTLTGTSVLTAKADIPNMPGGVEYSLNSGLWVTAGANDAFGNGDTIQFRATTSPYYSKTTSYTISFPWAPLTWSIGTIADPAATTWEFSREYHASYISLSGSPLLTAACVTNPTGVDILALTKRTLPTTGKWRWARRATAGSGAKGGICQNLYAAPDYVAATWPGKTVGAILYSNDGFFSWNYDQSSTGQGYFGAVTMPAIAVNDWVVECFDAGTGMYWTRKASGGNWNGVVGADPATGVGGIDLSRMGNVLRVYVSVGTGVTIELDPTCAALAVTGFAALSTS
jgi:hypothetical protein